MKTFLFACKAARDFEVEDQYMYVKAFLMNKMATNRQKEFANERVNVYTFRIPDLSKFQQN